MVMDYKFLEDVYIKELKQYVEQTYDQHYATDKYQATDVIIDSGHGTGFCMGNIIKYAKRYGRKGNSDEWRKDVMKILHYALIQLYVHDNTDAGIKLKSNTKRLDDVTTEEWNSLDLFK